MHFSEIIKLQFGNKNKKKKKRKKKKKKTPYDALYFTACLLFFWGGIMAA